MCGVLGIVGPSAARLSGEFEAALDSISHRGPDAAGVFNDEQFLFGHRRLAILDLSEAANQPMKSSRGVLVYNGEIYNHMDLRRRFSLGRDCITSCDSETLLKGIDSVGAKFFNSIEGMFAGAYYNKKERTLLLFRDSLGIKPIYYKVLGDSSVVFSSEIKAILKLTGDLPITVDQVTLNCYLTYENYLQDLSMFSGIHLVPPGDLLKFNVSEKVRLNSQQSICVEDLVDEADNISEQVYYEMEKSIERHLVSDVDLGVYLSGGIDSSVVSALASKKNSSLVGFTGYFSDCGPLYDEREISRRVSSHLNIDLVEVQITPHSFTENFDKLIYSLDEPRMGMGSFSQFMVAEVASSERKVILSGHGGDELFAGYPIFKVLSFFSDLRIKNLFKFNNRELPWLINAFLGLVLNSRYDCSVKIFKKFEDERFSLQKGSGDLLSDLFAYYQNVYLPGLLVVEDKVSMAHSLETRMPLWTQRMVQVAEKLSYEQKTLGGESKGILRQIAKDILPKELLTAPKRGFPTPLRVWFRDELFDFCMDRLRSSEFLQNYFSKKEIEDTLMEHRRSWRPFALDELRAHKIWMWLCLESWSRQYRVSVCG